MPTLDVHGVAYHVREAGAGPLVILGHSDASSGAQWRGLMDALQARYRLLAFDLSGQGRSAPWPAGRPHSMDAESAVVDALAAWAPGPLHLVGHSAGGNTVLCAALRLQARLASLTLVEPTAFHLLPQNGYAEAFAEIRAVAEAFNERVRAGRREEAMARFVEYWTAPGGWEAIPEERRPALLAAADKIVLEWDGIYDARTRDDYAAITAPTLLLRGTRTTPPARAAIDVLHGTLPHARLEEIEGAGHMAPLTHADAVIERIAEHLARCTA